jgi:biopolymer transport protein ExbB
MKKLMKSLVSMSIIVGACAAPMAAYTTLGQELTATEGGGAVDSNATKPQGNSGGGFYDIVFGSGIVGMILWFALFGDGALAIYFAIDSAVLIKPDKLMPKKLMDGVQGAMAEGDVMKALKACENEPSPMANILAAAFHHVEEGFDVIQEAVNAAADLETERIMQRLTWISVCSNLAPSLGLLGTVQGMIMCFATLASGVPDIGALAGNISQALWTTAGGLVVSIPSLTIFYSIRNNANRLILRMTALTMELIKDLRNVEVEGEAQA